MFKGDNINPYVPNLPLLLLNEFSPRSLVLITGLKMSLNWLIMLANGLAGDL